MRVFFLSPEIPQKILQLLARKEYPALDSSQRKPETVGYLTVLEARNVHKERYAVITG